MKKNEKATQSLLHDLRPFILSADVDRQAAWQLVKHLGCHVRRHNEESKREPSQNTGSQKDKQPQAEMVFWHPLIETANKVWVEFFELETFTYSENPTSVAVTRTRLQADVLLNVAALAVDETIVGNKTQFGALYQLVVVKDGEEISIGDPLAWSLPFGAFAPAEIYDVQSVLGTRQDQGYFETLQEQFCHEGGRQKAPVQFLEIHIPTATQEGTLASFNEFMQGIAKKRIAKKSLTPYEMNFVNYDAFQLMPVEPLVEHPENHHFWNLQEYDDKLIARVQRPSITNWGYDVPIFGSATFNATLLRSGRPHEFLDLIETLHNFPGKPIRLILDVVYGHADNQGLELLPPPFFTGPNMYGQDMNYQHHVVRAVLLQMLRRKMSWGVDGIRVDGAQDFKYFDKANNEMAYDDDFLRRMGDFSIQVGSCKYKPWMIYEDGRPWPREDWELASTYRELNKQMDHAYQWAPMIFAYNTPYLYTFWTSKWWRLREALHVENRWIGGYANHDTVRRGTQANPEKINVNRRLGHDLKQVMDRAYNNAATTLVMGAFVPGVPMGFVQSLVYAPWSFVRNVDTTWALKVVAEEAHFLDWQVNDFLYNDPRFFPRLKTMGFQTLQQLRTFARSLLSLVDASHYDQRLIAQFLNQAQHGLRNDWTQDLLQTYAENWMADLHEYTNAEVHAAAIPPEVAEFNRSVRAFRQNHPWLGKRLAENDFFHYNEPADGTVLYHGYRRSPEAKTELYILANMEGQPIDIDLSQRLSGDHESWKIALISPGMDYDITYRVWRLFQTEGVLFIRHH